MTNDGHLNAGRGTLAGRVPGVFYDEAGNEVTIHVEAFNRLPASRRPRVYDHRGLRVIRIKESMSPGSVVPVGGQAGEPGSSPLAGVLGVISGSLRLFVKAMLLLARLV